MVGRAIPNTSTDRSVNLAARFEDNRIVPSLVAGGTAVALFAIIAVTWGQLR